MRDGCHSSGGSLRQRGLTRKKMPAVLVPCMLAGLTLRQRLFRDKSLVANKEARINFGKLYYSRLRALYAESDGLDRLLHLNGDKPSPRLFEAFKGLISHPANRSLMTTWLASASSLDGVSVKVVMQGLRRLNPCACRDQLDTAMTIMQHLARLEAPKHYKEICAAMKDRFDRVMSQARTRRARS